LILDNTIHPKEMNLNI